MNGAGKKLSEFAGFFCCLTIAGVAIAANPPTNRLGILEGPAVTSLASKASRAVSEHADFSHLDLRPPASVPGFHNTASEFAPFPSARRGQAPTETEDDRFGGLGSAVQVHAMSRAQEIAHKVRSEGLPVARLWENHSALVSLGLNQRGKPGLWLMQKIP